MIPALLLDAKPGDMVGYTLLNLFAGTCIRRGTNLLCIYFAGFRSVGFRALRTRSMSLT